MSGVIAFFSEGIYLNDANPLSRDLYRIMPVGQSLKFEYLESGQDIINPEESLLWETLNIIEK